MKENIRERSTHTQTSVHLIKGYIDPIWGVWGGREEEPMREDVKKEVEIYGRVREGKTKAGAEQ